MEEYKVLLDKRRKYKGSLPCPQCDTSLLHNCIKNGVLYVDGPKDKPLSIWNADLYKCPTCGNLVLTDFGWPSQWNKKNTPDMQALLDGWKGRGGNDVIVYSWQFDSSNCSTIKGRYAPGRFKEAA